MYDLDMLLTDEFVQFSDNIKEVLRAKKEKQEEIRLKKEEFKKWYEGAQADLKTLESQASELQRQFNEAIAAKKSPKKDA